MSFVVPLETVHAEAQLLAPHSLDDVRACIVGGHAHVVTAVAGQYLGQEVTLKLPKLPEGAIVDPASVRVTLYAMLSYYKGSGFHTVPGYPDRISGPINLRSGPGHSPRDKALKSRNCELGDIVYITGDGCSANAPIIGLAAAPNTSDTEEQDWSVAPIRTILLQRNLPTDLREAKDLTIELKMPRKAIELATNKITVVGDSIKLPVDLTALNSQWFENGAPVALRITDAVVEVSYRAWLSEYSDKVYVAADFENVMKIAGPCHPDNPLRYGVELAHKNAGNSAVEFIAVANPTDMESWRVALSRVRKTYGIVPLSSDPQVLEMAYEVVKRRSMAETGRECVLWRTLSASSVADLAERSATINALPAGGFIAESFGATFMADGLRAGDMASVNDVDCVVDAVMNEETLLLAARGVLPTGVVQLRIWRKRTAADRAHAIGAAAAAIGDKRVRGVWPDQVSAGTQTIPGYYLCAALAGLRSGVAPHQDLIAVQLAGLSGLADAIALFDKQQLDMMAELGVWVVTDIDGVTVTRNAITTADPQNGAESNESVVTNMDTINKVLRAQVSEVLHAVRSNSMIHVVLKNTVDGALQRLMLSVIPRLGPQLVAGEVASVRRHVVLEDSVVLSLNLTLPIARGVGPSSGTIVIPQKLVA